MKKVYIETYGCTLNQADSDIMKGVLKQQGYEITEKEEESDAIIVNTCTVKGATENKIFARMKELQKQGKKFVVAGCMSANEPKIRKYISNAPIVGTGALGKIGDAVTRSLGTSNSREQITFKNYESKDTLARVLTAPILRIPINDGCTSNCYFCQTKIARPYLKSYSPKTISKWINDGIANGAREVQLTSMDSGAYGIDIKSNLVNLMKLVCDDDSDDRKNISDQEFLIRLGMINPNHAVRLKKGLIEVLKNKKMYKFIHIPVQSGSEKVCGDMNRDHSVADFVELVESLRTEIPEITLSTDIIVGYPTETTEDYAQTNRLLEELKLDIVNVSKFSPRPGTKAKEMKALDNLVVKGRSTETSALVKRISGEINKKLLGRTYRVLITEKDEGTEDYKGRNINYKQLVVKDYEGKLGEFCTAKIYDSNHGSLIGKII
ncbi:tRNA (N(6)-L-threonylcarbamoyladenosine(37)-C(2))-methylthiotransferase [Candidatus Micrarchaeota archaeon]|nr:tRNA (N(6)-L-threonylcarbamoyladenosine(37)-C(2))-methylthiotransferase [Candidatus Micrarchaeota archaeon]